MADDSTTNFRLDEDLSISGAAALHKRLLALLETGEGPVEWNGSAVERVDTASLQLVLAAVRALEASGRASCWKGVSDAMRTSVACIGLEEQLRLGQST